MQDWVKFWDSEHSIYVNARHRDVHYGAIADDVRGYIPGPDANVLDYGCGEALHADRIADAADRLILSDAAPGVRAGLAARYAGHPKIEVRAPDELETLPEATLDLIAVVSVAQYLAPQELDRLLVLFRRLLKPDGRLVLADVIQPSVSPLTDVAALLRFARVHGFLGAALLGLIRTALSDYSKLRSRLGLTFYDQPTMLAKLAAAGFRASRAPVNIGHNAARMTFVARRG
jgi:SAM-dependent methyltransferase